MLLPVPVLVLELELVLVLVLELELVLVLELVAALEVVPVQGTQTLQAKLRILQPPLRGAFNEPRAGLLAYSAA